MRITAESARIVSAYAGQLSNGYVGQVQTGSDIGNGARIMDGNSQTVWLAQPREAVAYYLGQIDVYAAARGMTPFNLPDDIQAIRDTVLNTETPRATVTEWYATGLEDGRSRVEHYCPEIRSAGKP